MFRAHSAQPAPLRSPNTSDDRQRTASTHTRSTLAYCFFLPLPFAALLLLAPFLAAGRPVPLFCFTSASGSCAASVGDSVTTVAALCASKEGKKPQLRAEGRCRRTWERMMRSKRVWELPATIFRNSRKRS